MAVGKTFLAHAQLYVSGKRSIDYMVSLLISDGTPTWLCCDLLLFSYLVISVETPMVIVLWSVTVPIVISDGAPMVIVLWSVTVPIYSD